MRLISELSLKDDIKDLDYSEIEEKLITAGRGISIFYGSKLVKKYSEDKLFNKVKFIKNNNQLFGGGLTFLASNSYGEVFKHNGMNNKLKKIYSSSSSLKLIELKKDGRIILLSDNLLEVLDPESGKLLTRTLEFGDGKTKIIAKNGYIIVSFRETHQKKNEIKIFDEDLLEIKNILTEVNHICLDIFDGKYVGGTENGELEIYELNNEEKKIIKVSEHPITSIEYLDNNCYIGTEDGKLKILDKEKSIQVHKGKIKKIYYANRKILSLGNDRMIRLWKILDKNEIRYEQEKFFNDFKIHEFYHDFFSGDIISKIMQNIEKMEIKKIDFTPKKENIFKALKYSGEEKKVVLLGMDPYPQENVATGLAFEVEVKSWSDKKINASLRNILKLIYKSYTGNLVPLEKVREDIEAKTFKILAPDILFKNWDEQGVLLLNTALTTKIGKPGEHLEFWREITTKLISYISEKNNNLIYFLWGRDAQKIEEYIKLGEIIKHNHPAICGRLENPNDFMNSICFEKTKELINWLGE